MKGLTSRFRFEPKINILIGIPVVFQIVFLVVLACLIVDAEQEAMRERHARAVIAEANNLLKDYMDLAALVYLYQGTQQLALKNRIEDIFQKIPDEFSNLTILVRESSDFKRDQPALAHLSEEGLFVLGEAKEILSKRSSLKSLSSPVFGLVTRLEGFLKDLRGFVDKQKTFELNGPDRENAARFKILLWVAAGVLVNTLIALFLAFDVKSDAISRLRLLMNNIELYKTNRDLQVPTQGKDEIADLDAQFYNMALDLREANRRKQELQAMVTHDLRTPLTSIRLSLSIMLQGAVGDLSAQAIKTLKSSERNCSRLIRLINDLLDIEKLESGNFQLDKKMQHVALLFEAVEDATLDFAADKNIELVFSEPQFTVLADGDRIVQVIVNLVSNSIKFSEKGKSVWIEAELFDDYVELAVKDEGRGIPAEKLPQIFDRFHQVSAEDGARGKGTGLGLSISKALVEAHEGTIGVESELGKGTRFWMRLPRGDKPVAVAGLQSEAAHKPSH